MKDTWYQRQRKERGEEFLKEYAVLKREWRAKGNDKSRRKARNLKARLCHNARIRGRKAGMEANISVNELYWPEYCPVLGMKLDYDTPRGKRDCRNPALPSLDRWDNTKGYFPGNVYVISFRANTLKNNATADELDRVADYCRNGIDMVTSIVGHT